MVEIHSWSSIKVDHWGLVFFYRHVLGPPLEWIKIVKPPHVQSLPDIPTLQEDERLPRCGFGSRCTRKGSCQVGDDLAPCGWR
jgi:hypothetical protein